MPTVQPGAKVLVSGANGFIAIHVVKALLEKGYSVRATVRSEDKGVHLNDLFGDKYGSKLEIAIVRDITADGAFDEAVKGVDAIEHTASPFHFNATNPQDLIQPAVKGTVGILQSARKHGSRVKRVIVTSSTASILQVASHPQLFSEKDWDEQAIERVNADPDGKNGVDSGSIYRASKTLAEKAAWEFVETNKGKISWDLAVLNPPFVFGPPIHSVSSPSALNTSVKDWYDTVLTRDGGGKSVADLATVGSEWVDVRDLAEAHVLALEKSDAGGERMIISQGVFKWQDFLDAANALPESVLSTLKNPMLVKGNPGAGSPDPKTKHMLRYDASKGVKILGLSYKTKEDTALAMIVEFGKRGW